MAVGGCMRRTACDHGIGKGFNSTVKAQSSSQRLRGALGCAPLLYVDASNFKRPSAQESTYYGGVTTWHVLRALTCPEKSVWRSA